MDGWVVGIATIGYFFHCFFFVCCIRCFVPLSVRKNDFACEMRGMGWEEEGREYNSELLHCIDWLLFKVTKDG